MNFVTEDLMLLLSHENPRIRYTAECILRARVLEGEE